MSIYTRTGDDGTTALFGGKRVSKSSPVVDVYGSIDELNSWIGLISAKIAQNDKQRLLDDIQSDLLYIGSVLAGWTGELSGLDLRVRQMEEKIDVFESSLPKLTKFILPGGSPTASFIHIARSVARRVERQVAALSNNQKVDKSILIYLNRLSDFLFMLARYINKLENQKEITWEHN